jgi:hypothetical protein
MLMLDHPDKIIQTVYTQRHLEYIDNVYQALNHCICRLLPI